MTNEEFAKDLDERLQQSEFDPVFVGLIGGMIRRGVAACQLLAWARMAKYWREAEATMNAWGVGPGFLGSSQDCDKIEVELELMEGHIFDLLDKMNRWRKFVADARPKEEAQQRTAGRAKRKRAP